MTPSAQPTSGEVSAYLVPYNLLQDGELIVLALKPSGWLVLLSSLPALAACAVVGALALAADTYEHSVSLTAVITLCVVLGLARVLAACWQWLGRTYVLTSRRIVTVRGVLNVHYAGAALDEVAQALLTATPLERMSGTGSIDCFINPAHGPAVSWTTIARPVEVNEIVQEAIARARKLRGGA